MSIEKIREGFEKAYADDFESVRGYEITPEQMKSMREGDHYGASRGYLNGCWWGWQAARAALVVELSRLSAKVHYSEGGVSTGLIRYDEVCAAIEDAGAEVRS